MYTTFVRRSLPRLVITLLIVLMSSVLLQPYAASAAQQDPSAGGPLVGPSCAEGLIWNAYTGCS